MSHDPANPTAPGTATRNAHGELPPLDFAPPSVYRAIPIGTVVRESNGEDLWVAFDRATEELDRRVG